MNALAAFHQGNLDEAVRLATEHVRSTPSDAGARYALAEFLCFAGQFERADGQLETAASIEPSTAVSVAQFRQIIRGEVARQDFHQSGRAPELLFEATPDIRARLALAVALRGGHADEARQRLDEAQSAQPPLHGHCTLAGPAGSAPTAAGSAALQRSEFDDFTDTDDLLGPVLEVLSGDGRYFWIPAASVISLQLEPPRRPRDLLFRQARLATRGGPEGEVFIPVLYAGSSAADRADLRLGRATDWRSATGGAADGPMRGLGQRVFLIGDEGRGVLELSRLDFD